MKHKCKALVCSDSNHLQQIYTGFELLHQAGVIEYQQAFDVNSENVKNNLKQSASTHSGGLEVILDSNITIYYDMNDSHEVDQEALIKCDVYFKRSFNKSIHSTVSKKINALDLNYFVIPDKTNKFRLERKLKLYGGKSRLKELFKEFDVKNKLSYSPRISQLHARYDSNLGPKVLFLCRLWEPDRDDVYSLSAEQQSDRRNINEMRVGCIRALKKKFGKDFVGGVAPTEYAKKHVSDVIFHNAEMTKKNNYLKYLLQFPIVISTTGLSGSIGWKFGEYVAFSKAIVSEKLQADTHGLLKADENYIEFNDISECINAVETLLNKDIRNKMSKNNYEYYQNYLKPEQLVLHSINRALKVVN